MESSASKVYIEGRVASAKSEEERDLLQNLADLYNQRLWHQLTIALREVAKSGNVSDLLGLYHSFVREFEGKMNPVELIGWAIDISRADCKTPQEAVDFLMLLRDDSNIAMRSTQAKILLLSELALLHLRAGDNAQSKAAITMARELVEGLIDIPGHIHSSFYRAAAEYHKLVGSAGEFYKNALQFLAYTPPDSLTHEEQLQWAFDLGNAALVGEDIYNYGELLSHAVISALDKTEHEWLLQLLHAFNRGDLTEFERVCTDAKDKMIEQPVLVVHRDLIRQKITILALMELAFTKTVGKSITFAEIAKICRLPSSEVEYLLMRALSMKLISGSIDSVDESVTITRVQPRVLGREPIRMMAERLDTWTTEVNSTLKFVEQETGELTS